MLRSSIGETLTSDMSPKVLLRPALCALLALLCGVVPATTLSVSVTVTCLLGGGAANPEWTLGDEAAGHFTQLALATARPTPPAPTTLMGFSGFKVQVQKKISAGFAKASSRKLSSVGPTEMQTLFVYVDNTELVEYLTESGKAAGALSTAVVQHIEERVNFCGIAANAAPSVSGCTNAQLLPSVGPAPPTSNDCDIPIVGPDSWKEIIYSPQNDDCGGFITYQGDNNCYDYGNDMVTNTFAQPGRGSGQKWTENTCDDMKRAAVADGLTWMGTELPTYASGPDEGHFVALYIWPDTNFHWARMDASGDYSLSNMVRYTLLVPYLAVRTRGVMFALHLIG